MFLFPCNFLRVFYLDVILRIRNEYATQYSWLISMSRKRKLWILRKSFEGSLIYMLVYICYLLAAMESNRVKSMQCKRTTAVMMLSHVSHLKINVLKIDLRLSKSNIPKNNRVPSSQEDGLKIDQIVFAKIRKHFFVM